MIKIILKHSILGIAINESSKGASVVMLSKDDAPKVGDHLLIKVGKLAVLESKCMWKNDLDEDVCRLGFELQE